jgi:hypothetical protein
VRRVPTLIRSLWRVHAPMTALGLVSALAPVALIGALAFDQRELMGIPVWFKPLKFMLSTTIYAFTFAWLLSLARRHRRLAWGAATFGVAVWTLELALITMQAARGVPSHFNVSTPFDTAVFSMMGACAFGLWVANILVAVALAAEPVGRVTPTPGPPVDPVLLRAVRYGLALTALGMLLGLLMPFQSFAGDHFAVLAPGDRVETNGGHSVGADDGGPGLPLLNWSTGSGDLRIAHFTGMHALQAVPLAALLVRRRRDLSEARRTAFVRVAAAGYLGLTLLFVWQAYRSQPLLHPDPLTWLGAAVLAAAVAAGALAALRPRPGPPAPAAG